VNYCCAFKKVNEHEKDTVSLWTLLSKEMLTSFSFRPSSGSNVLKSVRDIS